MTEWIDESEIGEAVPCEEQPVWLPQFKDFLRVNRLPASGELLLRCRVCDLALAVPPDFDPAKNPQTILNLARHGLEHAVNGELSGASGVKGKQP